MNNFVRSSSRDSWIFQNRRVLFSGSASCSTEMVENDFRTLDDTLQVQFLRKGGRGEEGQNSTKVSTKRGASLGPRLRGTLTRRRASSSFRWNCRSIIAPFVVPENCCLIPRKNFRELSRRAVEVVTMAKRGPAVAPTICACNRASRGVYFYSSIRFVTHVASRAVIFILRSYNFSAFKCIWEKILILTWRNSTRVRWLISWIFTGIPCVDCNKGRASSRALCALWNLSAATEKKPIAMTSRGTALLPPSVQPWIRESSRSVGEPSHFRSPDLFAFAPEWHVKNRIHKSILGRHHGNASLFRHGRLAPEVFATRPAPLRNEIELVPPIKEITGRTCDFAAYAVTSSGQNWSAVLSSRKFASNTDQPFECKDAITTEVE